MVNQKKPAKEWTSRIVGEGEEDPAKIRANPKNYRLHPEHQARALKLVMDEVGWVQRVIINKRTGLLVDGHLRVDVAKKRGEKSVPVEYVDLSEQEEALVLSTLDPLAGLAVRDDDKLRDLLAEVKEGREELFADLAGDRSDAIDPSPPDAFPEFDDDIDTAYRCPKCAYEWSGKPK